VEGEQGMAKNGLFGATSVTVERSALAPLTYLDIKAIVGVPSGSSDGTLVALVGDGTLEKGDGGYTPTAGVSDVPRIQKKKTLAGSGTFAHCVRCGGSQPRPDKGRGETLEGAHHRAIALQERGVAPRADRTRGVLGSLRRRKLWWKK
jgi:hypothetical protein